MSDESLAWMAAAYQPTAAEALKRLQRICDACPVLYDAVNVAAASHAGLSSARLGQALHRLHVEAAGLSEKDLIGLVTAVRTASREAFDAMMRTRQRSARAQRAGGALPWASGGD